MRKLLLVSLLAVALADGASANDCASIADDAERLRCYDEHAAPVDEAHAAKLAGGWVVVEKVDPMDDSPVVIAGLQAEDDRAKLKVQCERGAVQLVLDWDRYLADADQVEQRIDGGEVESRTWARSADSSALFYVGHTRQHLSDLTRAETAVYRVTPYREARATATFRLKGLRQVLEVIYAGCSKGKTYLEDEGR